MVKAQSAARRCLPAAESTCLVCGPCATGASSAEFEAGQSGGWSLHRQCRSSAHWSPAASWTFAHGAARPPKPLQPPAPAPGLARAQARAHMQFESSQKTAAQLQPTATLATLTCCCCGRGPGGVQTMLAWRRRGRPMEGPAVGQHQHLGAVAGRAAARRGLASAQKVGCNVQIKANAASVLTPVPPPPRIAASPKAAACITMAACTATVAGSGLELTLCPAVSGIPRPPSRPAASLADA